VSLDRIETTGGGVNKIDQEKKLYKKWLKNVLKNGQKKFKKFI
jgi:hypothetical protein